MDARKQRTLEMTFWILHDRTARNVGPTRSAGAQNSGDLGWAALPQGGACGGRWGPECSVSSSGQCWGDVPGKGHRAGPSRLVPLPTHAYTRTCVYGKGGESEYQCGGKEGGREGRGVGLVRQDTHRGSPSEGEREGYIGLELL